MIRKIGTITGIYRYPVKSMAGQRLDSAQLGWHGLEGDRRFAFLRVGVQTGFPWLTAGKLPKLIHYMPFNKETEDTKKMPTHIRTPAGRELEIRGAELQREIAEAYGSPVEMMQLDQGIFDEAKVSIISQATIEAIEKESGVKLEIERFRPNLLVETLDGKAFEEDDWVGKTLLLGEGENAPALHIYMRDVRCMMINLHPGTGEVSANVLKAVVRMNENNAGAYANVLRTGKISTGNPLFLQES